MASTIIFATIYLHIRSESEVAVSESELAILESETAVSESIFRTFVPINGALRHVENGVLVNCRKVLHMRQYIFGPGYFTLLLSFFQKF